MEVKLVVAALVRLRSNKIDDLTLSEFKNRKGVLWICVISPGRL